MRIGRAFRVMRGILTIALAGPILLAELAWAGEAHTRSLKPVQTRQVKVNWYSLTYPEGKEWELPAGVKSCTVLKVRAIERADRAMLLFDFMNVPGSQKIIVEDSMKSDIFYNGEIIKPRFSAVYNGVSFRKTTSEPAVDLFDENNYKLIINSEGHELPLNKSTYICIYTEMGDKIMLIYFSYFLS